MIAFLLLTLASPVVLWYLYAVVMALKQGVDRWPTTLPLPVRVLGYPALFVGLAIDLYVTLIICTLLFLQLPREWTVSGRLWRISNQPPSWRQRTALWLRVNLLDPLDPSGVHKG